MYYLERRAGILMERIYTILWFYMVSGEKGLYPDGTDYIFFMFRFYMVSGEKGLYHDGTDYIFFMFRFYMVYEEEEIVSWWDRLCILYVKVLYGIWRERIVS